MICRKTKREKQENLSFILISDYLKYKWSKYTNQKTLTGRVDEKYDPNKCVYRI